MQDYKNLVVWKLAKALAVACYKATATFPATEQFGLVSQIRRAAISISSNIAEGVGRNGEIELKRFLRIAHGSLNELESLVIVSTELTFIDDETAQSLIESIKDLSIRLRNLVAKIEATIVRDDHGFYDALEPDAICDPV